MNCVPIDMLPIHSVHCSLLHEQGKSVVVYFTLEHSFMVCAVERLQVERVWHHIPLIYTILIHVLHFEWNTFASNWNHGRISCDVHFAGHLRLNRTNIWSYKSNIQNVQSGGARGLELRTADLHTACLLQVVLTRLFIKARSRLLK